MGRTRLANPVRFICDMQEKFRGLIYEYPHVIATTQKMVAAAKILDVPVYCTTQNRARLGGPCAELKEGFPDGVVEVDKTAFSMVSSAISAPPLFPPQMAKGWVRERGGGKELGTENRQMV